MARLNDQNLALAHEIIERYPRPKSALIPLLHLAQEQDGYVAEDAMEHLAELVGVSPAEVLGTCSFYEMFKREPVGRYLINICTNISCQLNGVRSCWEEAEDLLGIRPGGVTEDGLFTLEDVECIAACTEAPCLQVNYRYEYRVGRPELERLIDDLRRGARTDIPDHGTLARVRQHIPDDKLAGIDPPEVTVVPEWFARRQPAEGVVVVTNPATNAYVACAPGYVDNEGPKIVTSRFGFDDSYTLARARHTGAYAGLRGALERSPAEVADEVKEAVLLGRGGAGFPAGIKWGSMPPVWPRYLVVNGDESEPGTYKDRLLMERDPHQLIEGCVITCYALGLNTCYLYIRGEMALAQERVAEALNDAYAANLVGKNILGTDVSIDVVLHWGAGAYIVGEETALIESLEGNRGMPRLKPPFFPAAKGLYMKPTIVNNVETLSNLPWLMTHGAAAYKRYGSERSPGTRMLAISGHVKRPGVYEVEHGKVTFRDLFYGDNFCQGMRDDNELKMFIPGGGSAPWFFPEQLDLPIESADVGAAGSMLGSGAIVAMDETTDAVRACLRVVRFFARESCGKCTPCREGTTWEEQILQRILDGHGRPDDIDLLLSVGAQISPGDYPVAAHPAEGLAAVPFPPKQTTICPLGPSSVAPITSAIRRFRHEFEAKIGPATPEATPAAAAPEPEPVEFAGRDAS